MGTLQTRDSFEIQICTSTVQNKENSIYIYKTYSTSGKAATGFLFAPGRRRYILVLLGYESKSKVEIGFCSKRRVLFSR